MRRFFRVYREKFWRLTLLNLVYFLCTLPLLLALYVCVNAALGIAEGDVVVDLLPGVGFYMVAFGTESALGRGIVLGLMGLSALLYGPLKFTVTGTVCSFYTGKYRFFADILARLKKKWGQALLLGVIDTLVVGRLASNIAGIQLFAQVPWAETLLAVSRWFSVFALLFWLMIRRYFFILSYSAELKLWPLLKNSYILAFSAFGKNAETLAASWVIWALTLLVLPLLTVILLPLFPYVGSLLATVCGVYPAVEKYVLSGPPSGGQDKGRYR